MNPPKDAADIESADIESLVRAELSRFRIAAMRDFIERHLTSPTVHVRKWDYSLTGAKYPCWLVADFRRNDTGIAYSTFGHADPWGVVLISDDRFGRDDSWFLTLEDAVINSGCWTGELPEDYEIS